MHKKYLIVETFSDGSVFETKFHEIPAVDLMMWIDRLPVDEDGEVFIDRIEFELVS